ncbi:unnamed protein product [Allacma fusca]|uniref:Uncharacterized protein n=1 Tax=Allacma fusca TaxID=39272 RepID=A0A8J2L559_9HEXA|nr:unnamed protein product [Allacma fusca]
MHLSAMTTILAEMKTQKRPSARCVEERNKLTTLQITRLKTLTEEEKETLEERVQTLGPLKDAVDELSAEDVNLLNFEEIHTVLTQQLKQLRKEFGRRMALKNYLNSDEDVAEHRGATNVSTSEKYDETEASLSLREKMKRRKSSTNSVLAINCIPGIKKIQRIRRRQEGISYAISVERKSFFTSRLVLLIATLIFER